MKKLLQFLGWPVIAGVLLAVVLVQYQQLQRLASHSATTPQQGNVQPEIVPTDPASKQLDSYADAVAAAAPSVISIHSTIRQQIQLPPMDELPAVFRNWAQTIPSEQSWSSLGSGVVISDEGHIITALHVIEGAENIDVVFGENHKTMMVRATLIGADPETDIALLQISADELPPKIPLGSSDELRVGDTVLAIGFPTQALMTQKSVTRGIVSALGIPQHGLPIVEYIQTDAALSYGNSGGALINARGELVGINSFIYSQSGESDGIGFAVPVNKAMAIVDQLLRYGEVTPGFLGVITGELLTPETSSEFFGRPDVSGLLIEQVTEDSPAEAAGIRAGDVMTAVDEVPISSVISTIDQINRKAPGETIDLQIYREGRHMTIRVTLGTGSAQYRMTENTGTQAP